MTAKRVFQYVMLVFAFLNLNVVCVAQGRNLLLNPNADQGKALWRSFGLATVERTTENDLCFVVRDGGYFIQDVELPNDAAGQYVALTGRGSSERINRDGAITGLPYLYGYMMGQGEDRRDQTLAYLQAPQMLGESKTKEWINMWGVFQVPKGTKKIRFFLKQALRNGVPHDGSAARFDDLGLYIFDKKEDAETFVQYR